MDLANGELGPLSAAKLSSGRTFTSSDGNSNVAVVDSNYATSNKLTTGSTITIAGTSFKVIGIVSVPASDNSSDTFIPLGRAQALAKMTNEVNTIYVAANNAGNISGVSKEISALLPSATVTNSSDLASEVTGSLASASSLANNLGKWLAIAVLAAAFLLASLLTGAAVSRRVREFGTLKALGWRSRRIVGQVMGESVVIGVIGGVAGVALGFGRGSPGLPAVPAADRVDRPDHRLGHPGRGARLRPRRAAASAEAAAGARARAGPVPAGQAGSSARSPGTPATPWPFTSVPRSRSVPWHWPWSWPSPAASSLARSAAGGPPGYGPPPRCPGSSRQHAGRRGTTAPCTS